MIFSKLDLKGWRQFKDIQIDFDRRLTVLTGSNGSGKSTILRLLGRHFGWNVSLIATPYYQGSSLKYLPGLNEWAIVEPSPQQIIGNITYSSGHVSRLWVPSETSVEYHVNIDNQAAVEGLNVSSHRPQSHYQQVNSIPTNAIRAENAYQSYFNEIQQRWHNSYTQFSPLYRMKEAIISMATFGPGNDDVQANEEIRKTYTDFKNVLRRVIPPDIGFKDIKIRLPDVVLHTESGDFAIDASSGGLMSLLDLVWQIFLYSRNKNQFVVLIDEPENHLHPSMQRSVLVSLLDAFLNAQFVVATHSPFVVSSVRESRVYVLRAERADDNKDQPISVSSMFLDHANKAGTASEILRDVLGVPVTLPIWAEREVEAIAAKFSDQPISETTISALRTELTEAGLAEYYPQALSNWVRVQ